MSAAHANAARHDPTAGAGVPSISDREFAQFQQFIFAAAGISLADTKKALVSGRLAKRLKHFELDSFGDYFRLIQSGNEPDEVQRAIDLLTTNETYFFREPQHFEFMKAELAKDVQYAKPVRVWSAAASSGEEPYSIAMLLEECLGSQGRPWEIVASDISMRVLERAATGHYSTIAYGGNSAALSCETIVSRARGQQAGTILVDRNLRQHVQFRQINLNSTLPQLGTFDFIFLRNVLLYFNLHTKREVVGECCRCSNQAAGSSSAIPKRCTTSQMPSTPSVPPLTANVSSGAVWMSPIKVMVVDDSAVARQVVVGLLRDDPGVEVIAAVSDPLFAMQKMQTQWPDVILLDVEMPRMDGITFLKQIMAERPTPVIICSTLTEAGAPTTLEALAAGAVTIITKPRAGLQQFLRDSAEELTDAIRVAARANVKRLGTRSARTVPVPVKNSADVILAPARERAMTQTTERVVVIGTSTGGTQASAGGSGRTARGVARHRHRAAHAIAFHRGLRRPPGRDV